MMMFATSSLIGRAEEHDAVHQQAGKDVVRPLAAARPLDDIRRIQGRHGASRAGGSKVGDGGLFQQVREHFFFGDAAFQIAQPVGLL